MNNVIPFPLTCDGSSIRSDLHDYAYGLVVPIKRDEKQETPPEQSDDESLPPAA